MNDTQPRELTGALFRESARQSDRHPEMTGYIIIHGIRYRLAGWIRTAQSGRRYLSLRATPDAIADAPKQPDAAENTATETMRSVDELAAAKGIIPTAKTDAKLDDEIPW